MESVSSFLSALRRPSKGRYSEDALRSTLLVTMLLDVAICITFLANTVKCSPPNIHRRNLTAAQLPDLGFVELKCATTAGSQFLYMIVTTGMFLVYSALVFSRSSAYVSELSAAVRRRVRHDEIQIQLAREAAERGDAVSTAVGAWGGDGGRRRSASSAGSVGRGGDEVAPLLAEDAAAGWSEFDTPAQIAAGLEDEIVGVLERFRRFKVVAVLLCLLILCFAGAALAVYSARGNVNGFACHLDRYVGLNADYPDLVYTCASVVAFWLGALGVCTFGAQVAMLVLMWSTHRALRTYQTEALWRDLLPKPGVAGAAHDLDNPFPLLAMGGVGSAGRDPGSDAASLFAGAVSGFLAGDSGAASAQYALPGGLGGAKKWGAGSAQLPAQLAALHETVESLSGLAADLRALGDPALLASVSALSQQRLLLDGLAASFRTGLLAALTSLHASMSARLTDLSAAETSFLAVLADILTAAQSSSSPDMAAAVTAGMRAITTPPTGE